MKSICVYCASSSRTSAAFQLAAERLGQALGSRGTELVFGGTAVGLMKIVADSAKRAGSRVVGVIPRFMVEKGICFDDADEVVVVENMRERKAVMEARADAFVALPGGIGTLEELAEIMSLRRLELHAKPIVLVNVDGFYEPFVAFLHKMIEARVAHAELLDAMIVADDVELAFKLLDDFRPTAMPSKWA